jgi:hypothetical protein
MKGRCLCLLFLALGLLQHCAAQDSVDDSAPGDPPVADSLSAVRASTSDPADVSAIAEISASRPNADPDREVSWKRLVPNMARDQKQMWLFPLSVAHGHHLMPTLAFVTATAAFMTVDAHNAKYFRHTTVFRSFDNAFSGRNTSILMEALPTIMYGVGLARKDSYMQHTFLLAGEAILDSEILTSVMKDIDRRLLPGEVLNGNFSESWFRKTDGSLVKGRGSFPSGHGIVAFSLATVIADRYPHPSWIPYTSYGLASLVAFSRLPLQAHFSSDAFAAAVLGYVIAHYVVLHRTRTSLGGARFRP